MSPTLRLNIAAARHEIDSYLNAVAVGRPG
jgi:hypothetical protein